MNNDNKNAYNIGYNRVNYKQLKAFIKPNDYNLIDDYCKAKNVSKASLIVKACKYVINNDISLDNID